MKNYWKEKNNNVFKLEGIEEIEVFKPGLNYYVDLIRNRNFFAFIKRTHGFWDLLVDLMEMEKKVKVNFLNSNKERNFILVKKLLPFFKKNNFERKKKIIDILEAKSRYKYFWRDGFINELLFDLNNSFQNKFCLEAISFRGYPRAGEFKKRIDSRHSKDDLIKAVGKYVPRQPKWHDALVFKEAVLSGELIQLVNVLKGLNIIVIGPQHLESLGKILNFSKFYHISIHPTDAIGDRKKILDEISVLLMENKDIPSVCLFQSFALGYWLIYRLYHKYPNCFYLDLGRVLDIWYPKIISDQPWFKNNKNLIIRKMKLEKWHK